MIRKLQKRFVRIAVLVLTYATYVLTPKNEYGICSMVNYYQQPKDSIDVLVIGTSMGYAGINTNVLWEEFGIASYILCSAEQPFWISYYTLQEALKTQHPKVILLDAKPAMYNLDYSKRGRTILSTFSFPGCMTAGQRPKRVSMSARSSAFSATASRAPRARRSSRIAG